jgi:hypothetical protein
VRRREDQELQERRDLDRAESLRRVGDLAAGERGVQLVHEDRRVPFSADPLGEPDVVRVAVGQDDRPDIVERAAHRGQLARKIAKIRRRARIDDRHLATGLDEVRVDEAVSQSPDARPDLHPDRLTRVAVGGEHRVGEGRPRSKAPGTEFAVRQHNQPELGDRIDPDEGP